MQIYIYECECSRNELEDFRRRLNRFLCYIGFYELNVFSSATLYHSGFIYTSQEERAQPSENTNTTITLSCPPHTPPTHIHKRLFWLSRKHTQVLTQIVHMMA